MRDKQIIGEVGVSTGVPEPPAQTENENGAALFGLIVIVIVGFMCCRQSS